MKSIRPRLIFLSQLFDPEPAVKGLHFAKGLIEQGFEVEVVTGFPNYPGGKLYPGYRISPLKREVMEGVDVTRLAIYPSHDASGLKRILCYGSFMMSAIIYLLFFARRYDVVFVSYPSLTAGLAAAFVRIFRRKPVVLDIQDMWPDSLPATGMINNQKILSVIGAMCKLLYRLVDHIVVLSPGFKTLLQSRGVAADKITVVYNWADETELPKGEIPASFGATDKMRVLFAGNMGAAQGLASVMTGAALVAKSEPGIKFYFLGAGLEVDRLKQLCAERDITNVTFLPRVPITEVGAYLAAADALLVHLKDDPLFAITIPSKTQAYLRAGRPILMGVRGDAAELIKTAQAGVVFEPEQPQSFADAVLALYNAGPDVRRQQGSNGTRFYRENLSFDGACKKIAALVKRMIVPNGTANACSGEPSVD